MTIFASVQKFKRMGHLTKEQRCTIFVMKQQGCNNSLIALMIGKDKSVISRELKRDCDLRSGRYNADLAQRKYESRKQEKPKRSRFTEAVRERVEALLREDYSPEQVTGRCRLEGTECVSHERIYRHVWEDKRRGGDLHTHLRRKGRRYRKRGASKDSRGIIKDRIGIEKRPAIVEQRSRFGDLEVDTVIGKNHKGASFENLTDEHVKRIQNKLNNRPGKRLGFMTPIEYFFANFAELNQCITKKVAFVT